MRTEINVGDAMTTRPITTTSDTSIRDCARLMKKFDVGSILIEKDEQLEGIVTEHDLTRKVVAEGKNTEDPVKDVMENVMITINPETDISEAIKIMNDNEIRHLPVVQGDDFKGLITMKDILKIEPELFDIVVEKIRIREEARKPVSEVVDEGICESCGNYTETLRDIGGSRVCSECRQQ